MWGGPKIGGCAVNEIMMSTVSNGALCWGPAWKAKLAIFPKNVRFHQASDSSEVGVGQKRVPKARGWGLAVVR